MGTWQIPWPIPWIGSVDPRKRMAQADAVPYLAGITNTGIMLAVYTDAQINAALPTGGLVLSAVCAQVKIDQGELSMVQVISAGAINMAVINGVPSGAFVLSATNQAIAVNDAAPLGVAAMSASNTGIVINDAELTDD
jgi:hypothetical protein